MLLRPNVLHVKYKTDDCNMKFYLWLSKCFHLFFRHVFHKMCVDPWLNEHCTCPMCKLNILKALGVMVSTHRHTHTHTPFQRDLLIKNKKSTNRFCNIIAISWEQFSTKCATKCTQQTHWSQRAAGYDFYKALFWFVMVLLWFILLKITSSPVVCLGWIARIITELRM